MVWWFIPAIIKAIAGAATAAAPAAAGAAGAGGLTSGIGGFLKGLVGKAISPIKEGVSGLTGLLKPGMEGGLHGPEYGSLTGMLKGAGKHLLKQQTGIEGTPKTAEDWMDLMSSMQQMQKQEERAPEQPIPTLMGRRPQEGLQSLLEDYWDYY